MEREVMEAIYHAFQHWMLCACLAGLGMIAALLFLAKVAAPAWDALRRWWSLPCIQRILVGVCVVGLSYYGATKQGWHVAYDGGIKAGATANVVTNDTVSIHWQRDTSGGVYVPETATVYIDYRPNTETNAEWGLLAQTTVGAWGWSGTVENATNYDYNVWAYYIPPEPVHTNGVWTYKTHFDRNGEYALPLRARVEVNGVAIATPAEKRKDAERRPYDAEVEYLESTGTQWIDTGVIPNGVKSTIDFALTQVKSGQIAGCHNPNNQRYYPLEVSGTPLRFKRVDRFDNGSFVGTADTNRHTSIYYYDGDKASFDGTESQSSNYAISSAIYNCILFGITSGGVFSTDNAIPMKIFGCKMEKDGVVLRDFQPVRFTNELGQSEGAMYDKRGVGGMNSDGSPRNDGMYFNRGTGNFGYGNDK